MEHQLFEHFFPSSVADGAPGLEVLMNPLCTVRDATKWQCSRSCRPDARPSSSLLWHQLALSDCAKLKMTCCQESVELGLRPEPRFQHLTQQCDPAGVVRCAAAGAYCGAVAG